MAVDIVFDEINHFYVGQGNVVHAVDNVSVTVPPSQFVAFVGPSGCGKTTLMNMAAGVINPTRGSVQIGGTRVTRPTDGVNYMLARDALLPWRTARGNVELSLERTLRGDVLRSRSTEWLGRVGLAEFTETHVAELSQGMRQRVALARTLAPEPKCLLMDEPFAAVDAQTRVRLHGEFLRLWDQSRATTILVTHDVEEALLLSDRVLVFSPRPARVILDISLQYPRPRDIRDLRFEASFRENFERIIDALEPEKKQR